MSKKKILHRFMSLLLAFCMALSMLPGQALAASASDDPSTWPAPDSKYTASGKNPVYVYLDYSTDEGIAAGHLCNVGASLNREIVQATATTSGYIKYTCSDCGSWAQINVPALPVSAFTLNSAYQSMIDNGVEYTGRSQTLVYDIASAYQRFVGASLTNNFNATNAGSYNVQITVASDIYDNVVHVTDETLVIKPKQIPWTTQFRDKIYDGTNALTGQTVSYTDVNGKTVNVPLKTYLITNSGGQPGLDKTSEVTAPIAAGFYGIWSEITDKNYVWSNSQGTTANVMTSVILVYPKADAIYVNDSASDVNLTTGSSTNTSAYTWTVDNTYTGFDSSKPGTTNVQYKVARQSSGTAMADVAVSVTVKARSVLTVEGVSRSAPLGTAFSQLNLPTTVSVTAEGGKTVTGVPVTWNSSGYNANTKNQTVTGTLNVSSIPELSSTNAPTNVGNYTATVSFVMENGYAQLPSAEVKYIIGKAAQNFPEPVLSYATTTTLTLVAVDNAEYSMDGQIWQDSPIFRSLDPGTTYTLYQRLKEDGSGNYEETPTTSGQFTTEYESAGELNLQAQTSPYTGSPISYKVPTVSLAQQITVVYTVGGSDTTTAPTNAGTYPVKVTFTMRPGAAQIEPVTTSLTITKISQNAPSAPKASNVGTNSCGNLHRNCDFLPRCEPYACLW